MIIPDKKKVATMIVAKMSPKGEVGPESEQKPEEEIGDESGLHAAAEDVLSAIQNKSAADLKSSLKAFFEMVDVDEVEEAPEE